MQFLFIGVAVFLYQNLELFDKINICINPTALS